VEVCIEVPTYEEDGNTGGQWDPNENTGGGVEEVINHNQ